MAHTVLIKKGLEVKDIKDWGLVCKDFPFLLLKDKPKNIYTREYKDEDENYVFVPDTVRYDGKDFSVTFYYGGTRLDAFTNIQGFINYIADSEFTIYNQYLGVGRQKTRMVNSNVTDKSVLDSYAVIEVTVNFRTEDNINNISL